MNTMIAVNQNDLLETIRGFLRSLLESRSIDSLFAPLETADGVVVPALITDPEQLQFCNPLAPIMPINSARAVSALTHGLIIPERENKNGRLGVILRPCEIRALIELIKLKQVQWEEITLIGMDCPGTFELTDYLESQRNQEFPLVASLVAASRGEPFSPAEFDLKLRPACQLCAQPVPNHADIHIHLFGAELTESIPITIKDEIATNLDSPPANGIIPENRDTIVTRLLETNSQVRKKEFEAIRDQMSSDRGLERLFAACIRCHNCMTVCPICYCKTCLFRTKDFDHQPEHYLNIARRKGATRLLGDTLLFHLTRMNHMSLMCVNCGMCSSACPSDIPVGTIFSAVGAQVQAAFDYMPGRSVEEPLPLVTFQAEELEEIGETG
jgi:formate dehydrogenase subunit beta